jgi:hypothetical protein
VGPAAPAAVSASATFFGATNVQTEIDQISALANAAYMEANAAYVEANSVYGVANNALTTATEAENIANTKLSLTGGTVTGQVNITNTLIVTSNVDASYFVGIMDGGSF